MASEGVAFLNVTLPQTSTFREFHELGFQSAPTPSCPGFPELKQSTLVLLCHASNPLRSQMRKRGLSQLRPVFSRGEDLTESNDLPERKYGNENWASGARNELNVKRAGRGERTNECSFEFSLMEWARLSQILFQI